MFGEPLYKTREECAAHLLYYVIKNHPFSDGKTRGVPAHDQDITIHSLKLHFGKILTGCEGGQTEPSEDIPRYLRLHEAGKLVLDGLVTHRFPLEKVNDALDALRSGDAGRCMLEISH